MCPPLAHLGRQGRQPAGPVTGVNPRRDPNSRIGDHQPRRPVLRMVRPRRLPSGMAQSDPIRTSLGLGACVRRDRGTNGVHFPQNYFARSKRDSYAHQMFDQPLEPLTIAFAIATMAIGSAIQASVGIGLALFVVPLLALVDQSFIPGPMLLAGVLLALMTAYRERAAIDVPALGSSLAGLAIGTVAGAFALRFASGPHLGKTFGALVLLAVLLSVAGCRFTATRRSLMIAGGAAGVMGAMAGIHGPPISLVFQNAEPRVARGMLSAFFSMAYLAPSPPSRLSDCSECHSLFEPGSWSPASLSGS